MEQPRQKRKLPAAEAFALLRGGLPLLAFLLPVVAALWVALRAPTAPPLAASAGFTQPSRAMATPAQRVVIFPVVLSSYLTMQNGSSSILAASPLALEQARGEMLDKAYPEMREIGNIATLGKSAAPADPEQVMKLSPGAVLAWAEQSDGLSKAGLPVVEIRLGGKDQARGREKLWRLLAQVSGQTARGEFLLQRCARKNDEIRRLAEGGNTSRPRVALLYRLGNGALGLGGRSYNLSDRLALSGASNVAQSAPMPGAVNLETLLALDPDVIFFNSAPNDDLPQQVQRRAGWQALRAVRAGRVYKIPTFTFMNAATNAPVEDPLLLLWMEELLYPQRMPRRLRQEFRATFAEVYGYQIRDDEIDQIIYFDQNQHSAYYDRFAREH